MVLNCSAQYDESSFKKRLLGSFSNLSGGNQLPRQIDLWPLVVLYSLVLLPKLNASQTNQSNEMKPASLSLVTIRGLYTQQRPERQLACCQEDGCVVFEVLALHAARWGRRSTTRNANAACDYDDSVCRKTARVAPQAKHLQSFHFPTLNMSYFSSQITRGRLSGSYIWAVIIPTQLHQLDLHD